MDDECDCPRCTAREDGQPDYQYLWQFYAWVLRIDPAVIAVFDAAYGDNELTMN